MIDDLLAHLHPSGPIAMHPDLETVFAFFADKFPGAPIAVIGSAVKDYDTAHDIDVLLPHDVEWHAAMKTLGTRYNGWDTKQGHLRRANLTIPDVSKPVQVLQVESTPTAGDHPNAALLADGTVLKPGAWFDKAHATKSFLPKPRKTWP
jgi:hypothetical protein